MIPSKTSAPIYLIIQQLLQDPRIQKGFKWFDSRSDELLQEHFRICEIPAPIFQEQARGEYIRQRFAEIGLVDVEVDRVGNVMGYWPQRNPEYSSNEYICLSAHLDTVFPATTDCRIQTRGKRFYAPGISDNASGLIGMLAMAQAFTELNLSTEMPILFVATVCEEGIGDLRGVRYLFNESRYRNQIKYFISFDGPGIERVTHRALGSKRYQVTFKGPGGHSWGDFGIVNPAHALGRVIAKMADYKPPQHPRTTYNVGVIEAGSSVNTIPHQARLQIDLRSTSETELTKIEAHLMCAIKEAMNAENQAGAYHNSRLETEIELIGHRPSGELPATAPLVQAALDATRALGVVPFLECSSTDANIPISMGLEAITLGAGGSCGGCHTLEEWYEPTHRETSLKRTLLLLASIASLR